jgi:hypothetical protein
MWLQWLSMYKFTRSKMFVDLSKEVKICLVKTNTKNLMKQNINCFTRVSFVSAICTLKQMSLDEFYQLIIYSLGHPCLRS